MVLSYHNILRGENYGSVIIGDIAALAFVLFLLAKKKASSVLFYS